MPLYISKRLPDRYHDLFHVHGGLEINLRADKMIKEVTQNYVDFLLT